MVWWFSGWTVIGGALFNWLTGVGFTGFSTWGLFVAVVGAVIILAIVRALRGGTAAS